MSEAVLKVCGGAINVTTAAARTGGEVVSLPDGRAAVYPIDVATGTLGAPQVSGIATVTKPTAFVYLAGQEIYWDYSANATCLYPVDDKDFYLGVVQKDTASTDLTCKVALNVRASCVFNSVRDAGRSIMVRTAGLADFLRSGGSHIATFSTTAEAQKMDLISVRSVPVASKWIYQAVGTVIADCDADVGDLSFGMADATHASDADSITTSAFFHINMSGADLKIYGESDNAAAEVAATDTTKVFAVGTPFHLMIDGRSGDGSALAYYVNGVRVLSSTAFTVAGATGPLKALFHLEKSSNDSPGSVALDEMKLWLQDDAAA